MEAVKSIPTMIAKGRTTKQGLRDLNYYGPRPAKGTTSAPQAAVGADADTGPGAEPPAIPAPGADEEGVLAKA